MISLVRRNSLNRELWKIVQQRHTENASWSFTMSPSSDVNSTHLCEYGRIREGGTKGRYILSGCDWHLQTDHFQVWKSLSIPIKTTTVIRSMCLCFCIIFLPGTHLLLLPPPPRPPRPSSPSWPLGNSAGSVSRWHQTEKGCGPPGKQQQRCRCLCVSSSVAVRSNEQRVRGSHWSWVEVNDCGWGWFGVVIQAIPVVYRPLWRAVWWTHGTWSLCRGKKWRPYHFLSGRDTRPNLLGTWKRGREREREWGRERGKRQSGRGSDSKLLVSSYSSLPVTMSYFCNFSIRPCHHVGYCTLPSEPLKCDCISQNREEFLKLFTFLIVTEYVLLCQL